MDFKHSLKAIQKELQKKEKLKTKDASHQQIKDKPLNGCLCTDSQNMLKTLYTTEQEAQEEAKFSKAKLNVYPCPSSNGWHLSKV